jgi:hypothetical protein
MLNTALLVLTLGSPPGIQPPDVPSDLGEQVCTAIPPSPTVKDVTHFDDTNADGSRAWGAEATYELSSGDLGEAYVMIDSHGSGEGRLMINGDIIAHAAIVEDPQTLQPVTTMWWPTTADYPPEVIAEAMRVDLLAMVADSIPQEFKCSEFGKKVMKAGKYMVAGLLGAGVAGCCIVSQGLACIACGGAAAMGAMAGSEFADGYCD